MNGGIVSIDRLPVERPALSEGSPDFDGPSRNLSGRRVLPGTRKTTEASCFGTIHRLVRASEILDAHGRGRSESRTNFLGGPLFAASPELLHRSTAGHKILHYQLSYGATQDRFRPKKRGEGGRLKHSCPSMISLVRETP